jgi:hypothetical protein
MTKYMTVPENWKTVAKDGNPEPGLYLAIYKHYSDLVVDLLDYDYLPGECGIGKPLWYDNYAYYHEDGLDLERNVVAYLPESVCMKGLVDVRKVLK